MSDSSDDDIDILDNESLITDDEEDVMPSEDDSDSSDDEEFADHQLLQSRFQTERFKDGIASDIESDNEDANLPNSQAWGTNKNLFYETDFVDKDFRSQKQKEEDLAKYEEQEALSIQRRLVESVNEQDLGIDFLIDSKPKATNDAFKEADKQKSENVVELDLTTLKKEQKLAIIKRESPEFELLISDLKKYLEEIKSELEPVLNYLQQYSTVSNVMSSSGLKYLKLRYFVLLNYCTNISFYLSLKSGQEKQHVKEHPIVKEIFMHKKLILELDSSLNKKGKKFSKEMEIVRKSLQENREVIFVTETDEAEEEDLKEDLPSTLGQEHLSTTDVPDDEEESEGEDGGKRAITYEMEKNKGLIPKRKREQRNPRVKYRKKFEKAVIRRKGQVRAPRKELKKYGGEMTGINARTVKSIKFK